MAGGLTISTLNDSSGVLATQNGMSGIAKAWINYNGVSQVINSSFNISSVTYNATGDYTLNFTTAMPSANYCVVMGGSNGTSDALVGWVANNQATPTTTSVRVRYGNTTWNLGNSTYTSIAIFR